MGIVGLMTGAGAGAGIQEILKQRELARMMALRERAQASDEARNATQDQWQRQMFERTSARQDATDQRVNDAMTRGTITDSYAPGDTIEDPAQVEAAQRLLPGLVKLRGQQSGPVVGPLEGGEGGTLKARPITAPVGPTVADYQGTAAQRRQVGMDERAQASADLATERFDKGQANSDRLYDLAVRRANEPNEAVRTVQDYDEKTGKTKTMGVDARTGEVLWVLGGKVSAQQAGVANSMRRLRPVMAKVSELSEKINTGQGLIAKMSGGIERTKAQANYNDDVAEYQRIVESFTPLVARGLGHTGVLTQQDVDSARAMFPKPGDSKTLRDRLINSIEDILSQGMPGAEESGTGTTPPTPGRVYYDANGKPTKR